jgi:hypothetical protein
MGEVSSSSPGDISPALLSEVLRQYKINSLNMRMVLQLVYQKSPDEDQRLGEGQIEDF